MENSITLRQTNKIIAENYINAVGEKRSELFPVFLDEHVAFYGVFMNFKNAPDLIAAFNQLGKILLRNSIHKVFSDEDGACIIYDLVMADDLETVPCVEWISIEGGKIKEIRLVFDSKLFLKVRGDLMSRSYE